MAMYSVILNSGTKGLIEADSIADAQAKAEASIAQAGEEMGIDSAEWPAVVSVEVA